MDSQTLTIGKAIRPLFADPVTYYAIKTAARARQTRAQIVIANRKLFVIKAVNSDKICRNKLPSQLGNLL